jgi:hypothetical protein
MPIVPVAAIITAIGLMSIRCKTIKRAILGIIIVFSFVQWYVLSYGNWTQRASAIKGFKIFGGNAWGSDYESPPPHRRDHPDIEEIGLLREGVPATQPLYVGVAILFPGVLGTCDTVYWLKLYDKYLFPEELVEMSNRFLQHLDSFHAILVFLPPNVPFDWFEGDQFSKLLNRVAGNRIRQIKTFDAQGWDTLLVHLQKAKEDFVYVGEIRKNTYTCKIYKRIIH